MARKAHKELAEKPVRKRWTDFLLRTDGAKSEWARGHWQPLPRTGGMVWSWGEGSGPGRRKESWRPFERGHRAEELVGNPDWLNWLLRKEN